MADSSKPQPLPGGASSDNKESVKREEDLESVPLQVAAQLEPGKSSTSSLTQGRATQQMNEEETTDVGDSGRVRESGLTSCASGREMPNAEGDATSAACRPITVRNGKCIHCVCVFVCTCCICACVRVYVCVCVFVFKLSLCVCHGVRVSRCTCVYYVRVYVCACVFVFKLDLCVCVC